MHASKELISCDYLPQGGVVMLRKTYCGLLLQDKFPGSVNECVSAPFGFRATCIECLVGSHEYWFPAVETMMDMAKEVNGASGMPLYNEWKQPFHTRRVK